jgi:hypothetical protein
MGWFGGFGMGWFGHRYYGRPGRYPTGNADGERQADTTGYTPTTRRRFNFMERLKGWITLHRRM